MGGYIGSNSGTLLSNAAERKKTYSITTATTLLTGLAYTPTKVHVFHNGVRLVDGTDYTATNGTSITLTNAAQNGDEVVVISYPSFQTSDTVSAANGGTFAGNVEHTGTLTASGAFTSLGIDDNATSTAMTLDASGNLLVGGTSAEALGSATLYNTGQIVSRVDGTYAAEFRRDTSDGDIALFRKDGTTVGSISTSGGDIIVGTGTGRLAFYDATPAILPSSSATFGASDGAIDLGNDGRRFKDLYLGGGAYIGGTGAANYLDDYEEGSWTPVLGGSTSTSGQTYGVQAGLYTKVGNLVTATAYVSITSIGTVTGSYAYIMGLPFNVAYNTGAYPTVNFGYHANFGVNHNSLHGYANINTDFAYITYQSGSNLSSSYVTPAGLGSGPDAIFSITYMTDA